MTLSAGRFTLNILHQCQHGLSIWLMLFEIERVTVRGRMPAYINLNAIYIHGGFIMSAIVATFDTTLQKSNEWVREMKDALDWAADEQDAYHALRAGLHFLRDRLTPDEAAHLSAQLPMLIRGLYYEGWHPADKPLDINNYDDIRSYLADAIDRDISPDPTLILRALFQVLHNNITMGELEHLQSVLPGSMRAFWPNEVTSGRGSDTSS